VDGRVQGETKASSSDWNYRLLKPAVIFLHFNVILERFGSHPFIYKLGNKTEQKNVQRRKVRKQAIVPYTKLHVSRSQRNCTTLQHEQTSSGE
jgi:hypothetical protein